MSVTITRETPLSPEARILIKGSEQALRAVYRAEECFSFTAEELDQPSISFLVARQNGVAIGCVALVDCETYGEIKRLFVSPDWRGAGAARALMSEIENLARESGLTSLKLETGEKLSSAVALYRAIGYIQRGPFGDYAAHPASLFMEKELA